MQNKYRNSMGSRYLKGLFFETTTAHGSEIYTLKDWDHEGLPSLYLLYMSHGDILEYSFAKTYLDGWEHWKMLCECSWFKPYVERWREELELKIRSSALYLTIEDANSTSRSASNSRRFLLERGWAPKSEKGRPSKSQIKAEALRLAEATKDFEADLSRITIPTTPQ